MSSNLVKSNFVGFGFRELTNEENQQYCINSERNDLTSPPLLKNSTSEPIQFNTEFDLRVFSSGCYYYNTLYKDWFSDGVEVLKETNFSFTVCNSSHLTGN